MAKTKVIVADSGGISAPQMMDFWRKVGDGTIDGTLFQQFFRIREELSLRRLVTSLSPAPSTFSTRQRS